MRNLIVYILYLSIFHAFAADFLILQDTLDNPNSTNSKIMIVNKNMQVIEEYSDPSFKFSLSMSLSEKCLWVSYNYFHPLTNTLKETEKTRNKLYNSISCIDRNSGKEINYTLKESQQIGAAGIVNDSVILGGFGNDLLYQIRNGKIYSTRVKGQSSTLRFNHNQFATYNNQYVTWFNDGNRDILHFFATNPLRELKKMPLMDGRYYIYSIASIDSTLRVISFAKDKFYLSLINNQTIETSSLSIKFPLNFIEPDFKIKNNIIISSSAVSDTLSIYDLSNKKTTNIKVCKSSNGILYAEFFGNYISILCNNSKNTVVFYNLLNKQITNRNFGTNLSWISVASLRN